MEPLNPDIKSLDRIVLTKEEAHDLLQWGKANLDLVNAAKPMLREGLHVVLGSFTTYFHWLDDEHVQLGLLYTPQRFAVRQAVEEMLKGKDVTARQLQELAREDGGVEQLSDAAYHGIQKITGHIFIAIKEGRYEILDYKVEQILLDILANSKDEKWMNKPAEFMVTACLTPIQALNAYVEFMEPEVRELKEQVPKTTIHQHAAKDKKRKDKQRKPMTKLRSVYYVESIKRYAEKRGFTRHTFRWGVRGHFRHYKSGKTVFIRAYEKGKLREQRSTKTYTIDSDQNIQ